MTRRLLTLVGVIATLLVAFTALAVPSGAASPPVFTPPSDQVTRMDVPLDFSGASVTSPQGEDLAVFITADHGEVVPNGASTPICTASPTPGQLCFYTDPAAVGPLNFRGTESQVNQVMNSLKYIPAPGFPQPANGTLNDTLKFSATEQDIANGLSSGIVSATVRVEPDNEAPVFATIPDALTGVSTGVNQTYDFTNDIEVDDPDLYACDDVTPDVRTSTVSTTAGTLDTSYVAADFSVLGNGTTTIVLEGSEADINNAYDLMDYHPVPNTSYTDVITVFFDDGGCAGYGGHLTTTGMFPLEVVPGPATHFDVVIPPLAENGTPTAAIVTARDANNAVANDYAGMVELTSSDGAADLPPDTPLLLGVGTLPVTFNTDGTQTVTATDTADSSITGTSNDVLVATVQQVDHFFVEAPATAAAGAPFDFTVTAKDSSNATVTTYAGTVHVTSSTPGALPADATLTNGVGTFSATFTTATAIGITATDTVESSVTGSDTITITPGPAVSIKVTAPANATSGSPFLVEAAAVDVYDNLATGHAGTVTIESSDPLADLPADKPLNFGFTSFQVTLNTDGMQTVTATDTVTSSITGTSGAIDVSSQPVGPATHYDVSANATMTAGGVVDVQVTAKDANNATVTGYSGTVHLSTTDPLATPSADATLVNGVGNFTVVVRTAGTTTITATDTVTASITGTDDVVVTPGLTSSLTVAGPGNATAGSPVDVTVTAFDSWGNLATGYPGTVHLTTTDGAGSIAADATLTNGVGMFSVVLRTAGAQTVTATDTVTSSITGTTGSIVVDPAAADHLVVDAPATATKGLAVGVTVSAEDPYGNPTPAYAGTVEITSTDGSAVLPADSTLTNGAKVFPVTFNANGSFTVTATDTVDGSIDGTSGSVLVSDAPPAPATHLSVEVPATAVAGTAFNVTVTALDATDQTASGYSGTVHLTSSDGSAVLPADATLTNGVGIFSVTLSTAGDQTVTATDTATASITGTSSAIAVTDPAVVPEAEVGQSSVQAGGTILVEGKGFQPGEQVEVWLHSTPQLLATVVADQAGEIAYLATIPADTPAGSHHIELIGLTSAVQVATSAFTVTAAGDPTPTTTTTTTTAPAPTTTVPGSTGSNPTGSGTPSATSTTSSSGSLPVTGVASAGFAVLGLLLITGGLVVLAVRHRTQPRVR